jgi:hypothetical protein
VIVTGSAPNSRLLVVLQALLGLDLAQQDLPQVVVNRRVVVDD